MERTRISLSEVHQSVPVPNTAQPAGFFKRLLAFAGPAYLVSVGYMDPGNWATDLEGGASFGYALVWVLAMSNLMALLLQTLSSRLGIVAGRDLAQACSEFYPKPVAISLWILCEIAIIACDLAEVLGTALALNLLFDIPLKWGVLITAFDVFVLLALQRLGMKKLEAVIISLVMLIGLCFLVEMFLAKPDIGEVVGGLVPRLTSESLFVAIGIIGATVMPHNLYLHSALVQTRQFEQTPEGKRQACKYNLIDSAIALNGAFFINAAILVLAGTVFFSQGIEVREIQDAHKLLTPLLGTTFASLLFAVALLASGQSSTVTGTLAGQIVMEGFIHIRLRPAMRRMITRLLAIVPAAIVIWTYGETSSLELLILSQVILSMQLSFAIIPLIHFTSDRRIMGDFVNKLWVKILAWISAAIILSLNIKLIIDKEIEALTGDDKTLGIIAIPFLVVISFLLLYILFKPLIARSTVLKRGLYPRKTLVVEPRAKGQYKSIGVALDGSDTDTNVIREALQTLAPQSDMLLMHVVVSATGVFLGDQARDAETIQAEQYLNRLAGELSAQTDHRISTAIGYGSAPDELVRIAKEHSIELLVMGAHGHRGIGDIVFGATVSPVRHALDIPVLVVK